MRISTILSVGLSILTATASPANVPNLLNLVGLDQVPLAAKDEPVTCTTTVTHTHFEVNVVSTVYRTKPEPTQAQAQVHVSEGAGAVPVWHSQPENPACNLQACAVCYLVNKCDHGDKEAACPNCDHASYCQGCTPTVRLASVDDVSVEMHSKCIAMPGQEITCDTNVKATSHHAESSDTTT